MILEWGSQPWYPMVGISVQGSISASALEKTNNQSRSQATCTTL